MRLLLLILLYAGHLFAYSPYGHEVIEASAYKYLLKQSSIDSSGASGKDIIAALIAQNIFETPEQWNTPIESECTSNELLGRYPVLGSGIPDLIIPRQLSEYGQCFHYMSTPEDVITIKSIDGVTKGMAESAPIRCNELMRVLTVKLLENSVFTHSMFENIYAVMHMIVDSYSRAHAERSDEGVISYIKPWRLVAAPKYLVTGEGWDSFATDTHHKVFDERDEDYIKEGAPLSCREAEHQYLVEDSCLSLDAIKARNALVAYIEMVWRMSLNTSISKDSIVTAYQQRFFEIQSKPDNDKSLKHHISKPVPLHTIVGYRYFSGGHSTFVDAWLLFDLLVPLELGVSLDVFPEDDGVYVLGSYYPAARLPILYNAAFVFKPFRRTFNKGPVSFFHTVELDLYYKLFTANIQKSFGEVPKGYDWAIGLGVGLPITPSQVLSSKKQLCTEDIECSYRLNDVPPLIQSPSEFVYDPDYINFRVYIGEYEEYSADIFASLGFTRMDWRNRVGLRISNDAGLGYRGQDVYGILSPNVGYYVLKNSLMIDLKPLMTTYSLKDNEISEIESWLALKFHYFQKLNVSLEMGVYSLHSRSLILHRGGAIRFTLPFTLD